MKQIKFLLLGLIMVLMVVSTATAKPLNQYVLKPVDYPVLVSGVEYKDDTVPFLNHNGTIYVPLRAVSNLLDVGIHWNEELGRVEIGVKVESKLTGSSTVAKGKLLKEYVLTPVNYPVLVNGVEFKDNQYPFLVRNGTTYVPLRAVSNLLNVGIHWDEKLRRVEIGEAKAKYSDGRYRGIFQDSGIQQVSIQFDLKNDIIQNAEWRHLYYKGVDYRAVKEGDPLYPVKQQHDQILEYLKGKHISIIQGPNNVFLKPGDIVANIDGFTGATIRGTKISSAMMDALNRRVYDPRGNVISKEIGKYDNGRYRGAFGDGGYQQVSIQFDLKDNVMNNISYRHLYYKGEDYRAMKEGDPLYPVVKQHEELIKYLEGKPLETLYDLHSPGKIIADVDGFTGATVRSSKVLSAIMDGLNRGVY